MDKCGAWVRLLLSTLTQEGCSRSAALVLAVIADKATEREDKRAWMRQKEIAAAAGVDPRTVRRALQQLRTLGLIETDQKARGELLCYRLTDAVELPVKRDAEVKAAAARKRHAEYKKKAAQAKRLEEYAAAAEIHRYDMGDDIEAQEAALAMSLVNRFREDEEKEDAS